MLIVFIPDLPRFCTGDPAEPGSCLGVWADPQSRAVQSVPVQDGSYEHLPCDFAAQPHEDLPREEQAAVRARMGKGRESYGLPSHSRCDAG